MWSFGEPGGCKDHFKWLLFIYTYIIYFPANMSSRRRVEDIDNSSEEAKEEQERVEDSEDDRVIEEEEKDADDLQDYDDRDYE